MLKEKSGAGGLVFQPPIPKNRAVNGKKTTLLDEALDAYREVQTEREREQQQGDLFDDDADIATAITAGAVVKRGPGRPPGARNRRTDEMSRWFIARTGRDPLEHAIEVAGLPILAPGVLEGLAERLGMTRPEAAKFWASCLSTTLPFCHQRLSQLEVKPPGAPGSGQPVTWTFSDGQVIDLPQSDVPDEPERG